MTSWDLNRSKPDIYLFSDASGFGGVELTGVHSGFISHGLQVSGPFQLIPVVIAAAIFDQQWDDQLVQFSADNVAIVHVLKAIYCKNLHLMHLIRILVFLVAYFNFWFVANHIMGKDTMWLITYPGITITSSHRSQSTRFSYRSCKQQPTGVDIHRLNQGVLRYYEAALISSTHKIWRKQIFIYL